MFKLGQQKLANEKSWPTFMTHDKHLLANSVGQQMLANFCWSCVMGFRTGPVWDKKNRSWSWSCRSGVVLWNTVLSRLSS